MFPLYVAIKYSTELLYIASYKLSSYIIMIVIFICYVMVSNLQLALE